MLEQPLVLDNGQVVRFPLCELRGDWKFYKAFGTNGNQMNIVLNIVINRTLRPKL